MESEGRWLPPGVLPVGDDEMLMVSFQKPTGVWTRGMKLRRSTVLLCLEEGTSLRAWTGGLDEYVFPPTDTPSIPPPIGKVKA